MEETIQSQKIQSQMTEAEIEREAIKWLEQKEAALRRKRSKSRTRREGHADRG